MSKTFLRDEAGRLLCDMHGKPMIKSVNKVSITSNNHNKKKQQLQQQQQQQRGEDGSGRGARGCRNDRSICEVGDREPAELALSVFVARDAAAAAAGDAGGQGKPRSGNCNQQRSSSRSSAEVDGGECLQRVRIVLSTNATRISGSTIDQEGCNHRHIRIDGSFIVLSTIATRISGSTIDGSGISCWRRRSGCRC